MDFKKFLALNFSIKISERIVIFWNGLYLLETFAMTQDAGGNDPIWCVLAKNLALQGGDFAHIWLQTISNPPLCPKGGGRGFN